MKLYSTTTSPYGRVAKIVVHELGLTDDVEFVVAKTRKTGSPYYDINITGRVPYLMLDDGTGIEDSQEICAYLDHLVAQSDSSSTLAFTWPHEGDTDWHGRHLHRRAESLIDGASVWIREYYRPENERSPTVISHERIRAYRQLDWWEKNIDHPRLSGELNLTQVLLYCGLDLDTRLDDFPWRDDYPALSAFMQRHSEKESIKLTAY